ncbi:MAG: methyltransferase protein [Sediminibacterium sp.]|nr:methyltransferase protein [Sediminibacterium sp.]
MNQWLASDLQFHKLYPDAVLAQASMHWTPLYIARKAAEFLAAEKDAKILDIGSGAGKFCLAAAAYQPNAFFYGVEQREYLVTYAETARITTGLQNVFFIHGNITGIDFNHYDHFYFFNAFYENINDEYKIDNSLAYSKELYSAYNRCVYKQLDKKPAGTRLTTFHSTEDEIPPGYHEVGSTDDNLLKFWIKV